MLELCKTLLGIIQPAARFKDSTFQDLERFGVRDGQTVRVESRRGAIVLRAVASQDVLPGSVFIPFHYREAAANVLTVDHLDPFGKIPEYKFCAVRLAPPGEVDET